MKFCIGTSGCSGPQSLLNCYDATAPRARYVQNGRAIALGRKNWLFCGSDAGGIRAAAFYTLIGTAHMNGVEPKAWPTDVVARIGAHPINRLAELLPGNWKPPAPRLAEADRHRRVAT